MNDDEIYTLRPKPENVKDMLLIDPAELERLERIEKAARKYMRRHQSGCAWNKYSDEKQYCSCGFEELNAALKGTTK